MSASSVWKVFATIVLIKCIIAVSSLFNYLQSLWTFIEFLNKFVKVSDTKNLHNGFLKVTKIQNFEKH